jgi:hypothetical protein
LTLERVRFAVGAGCVAFAAGLFVLHVPRAVHTMNTADFWLAFTPIAIVAALAALTLAGGARETAIVYLVTAFAAIAGFTYILWSDLTYVMDTHQSSTPIPRAVGSVALLSTVLAPLLIAPLLQKRAGLNESGPGIPGPELETVGQTAS